MKAHGLLLFTAKLLFVVSLPGALFLILARRWMGETRTIEWIKNLSLIIVTLVVMTILAEIGVRLLFSGITTTADNSSFWAQRWNATHVRRNHLGYREREFLSRKPVGVYRIAVVGDSLTFGQGIEESDRFTNLLERMLNRGSRLFEVLNFGVPGANTIDEVKMLKDTIIGVEPDFVVLQWYMNDVEGHDTSGLHTARPLLQSDTLTPLLHRYSALYYVLNQRWFSLQHRMGWIQDWSDNLISRYEDPASIGSREATAMLDEFVRLCRERQIPVGIVLFPDNGGMMQPVYPYDFLHQRVLTKCISEGIECLDLRMSMAEEGGRSLLSVNQFDNHPNAEANKIAAKEIFKRFGPIWDRAVAD